MATTPTPRSYAEILDDMLATAASAADINSFAKGNPILSILEAASRSDARGAQDIFNQLKSAELDHATGQALDRIGLSEDVERIPETPSSGPITITDSSFAKIQSRIFQGKPAPNVGSAVLYVQDALLFPASGSVYIGRGTSNMEGPLSYTSKTNNGNYWTLNLGVGSYTQKYHNIGETVVLAQGGNRLIPAGTVIQTAQGNTTVSVSFSTVFAATIPDGEVEVKNIQVVCKTPGLDGNVAAGGVNGFSSAPFVGAKVSNPLPFSNGLETELDDLYKERIRQARKSRARGTALAIKVNVTGITSVDENRRVLSSSVLVREGYPTTLYIDDGTGYEAKDEGVPYEVVVDQALGGEQYLQLIQGRPVAKAYAETEFVAPFILETGKVLAVKVGGILSEHIFSASEFRNISNASAYEVVASINANSNLTFQARTSNNGTKVVVFAKSDENESVEIVVPTSTSQDANPLLGFPLGRNDTIRLYKNDRLLNKDGAPASISSNPQGSWTLMASGETLIASVDGISLGTITFTDQDFVDAGTAYSTLSASNSLASWAEVINFKVPGVTATATGGVIVLTSNLGRNKRAKLSIDGGSTLVTKGMFVASTSTGSSSDYTLDRNLGQIRINDSLVAAEGDTFTVGSIATRAFVESSEFNSLIFGSTQTSVSGEAGAELWFFVDGDASIVKAGVTGVALSFSTVGFSWGSRQTITAPTSVFSNVRAGDYIIVTAATSGFSVANRGVWKVVEATGTTVRFERPTGSGYSGAYTPSSGEITFVRATSLPQRVYIPSNSGAIYTATSIASAINTQLVGATASVYRTNQVRVRTNRFAVGGDIAFVASNSEGIRVGFEIGSAIENENSHLAAVESTKDVGGTPGFKNYITSSTPATNNLIVTAPGIQSDEIVEVSRPIYSSADPRYGNHDFISPIEVLNSSTNILLRAGVVEEWPGANRVFASRPFDLGAGDDFVVLVDGDTDSKRFVIPMYRKVTPNSSSYGITNTFKDKDNSNESLAKSFTIGMDWKDFAVYMKARGKTHRISNTDTNQAILWRYYRHGAEGENVRLKYVYPTAAAQTVLASVDNTQEKTAVNIRLASGVARTGFTVRNSSYIGLCIPSTAVSGLYTKNYIFNLPISTATRTVRIDYNTKTAGWTVGETITGATSGATAVISSVVGGAPGAASGTLVLSGGNNVPFLAGENLSGTTSGANVAKATAAQYGGTSRLTLSLPSSVTSHGLLVGEKIWMQSSDVNFTTGQKTISAVDLTWVEFLDSNTTALAMGAGTVSKDTDGEVTTTGSNIIAGDLMKLSIPSMNQSYSDTVKVDTLSSGLVTGATPLYPPPTLITTIQWVQLSDVSYLQFFPLHATQNAITAIATSVNAQANSPVSALAVGTGSDTSGSITGVTYQASPVGLGTASPVGLDGTSDGYPLYDGINWVRSHSVPLLNTDDFTFTFKEAVEPSIATNSDWLNEDIRIVPITTQNLVSYLNKPGPGGLFANSEILAVNQGRRPQIASLAVGVVGSVEVQGGLANEVVGVVRGAATAISTTACGINLATADTRGLSARHWVRVQNNLVVSKARITSATALSSIFSNTVTLTGTTAWDWATTTPGAITNRVWQIEKQGNFVCFTYVSGGTPSLAGVVEGDVVHVSNTKNGDLSPSGQFNTRNTGFFRIVRIDSANLSFWVENSNVYEESSLGHLAFLKYDSILPNDKLVINTSLWGSANTGTWTVNGISLETLTGAANNTSVFTVSGSITDNGAVAALGGSSGLIHIEEGSVSRLYKQILAIEPSNSDSSLTFIKFNTQEGFSKISENAGSYIEALDKLGFENSIAKGVDGYRYHTGLIGEANKVAYGLESDPQRYPGVVAAGARVNIEGPLVRKVSVALAIRARTGVGLTEIQNQVRSAVAATINGTAVGTHIAISDLIDAAGSVNGVASVAVISPAYSSGSDLIKVQPYEKPLVLSLDDDILVSFIGD